MDGTQQNATSSSVVTIKEVGGVKITGQVLSSTDCQRKVQETFEFDWETKLELAPGKNVITSMEFVIDYGSEYESHWQIELNPNFVDERGIRYLSVYLVLVKTCKPDDVKSVMFSVMLPTSPNIEGNHYSKCAGISNFSKEKPARGFQKFIELSKLGAVANPKSMEKLRLVIILYDFKSVPNSEPEKKANSVGEVPVVAVPHKIAVQKDAYINFDKNPIHVDPKCLAYYTTFFDKYVDKIENWDSGVNVEDLSSRFTHKALLMKIVDFCHNGEVAMPKKLDGVCNLLKAAIQVGILQLKNECQAEVLKRLAVNNFIKIVDMARDNFLDPKVAYPVIYKFMIENIKYLEKDHSYSVNYEDFKEFYQKLMLCEEEGDDDATDESGWISFYTKLAD